MCTATWLALPAPGSYELYFNRDESRLRGRATPPEVLGGEAVLAPRDADAGGTWIAANTLGVTVCLLNRYQDAERVAVPPNRRRSRGLLVLDLATSESVAAVANALEAQELDRYPAFTVLAAEPADSSHPAPTALHWTGRELLAAETPTWPVCSSGYDAEAATRARRELWHEMSGSLTDGTVADGTVADGTSELALELHRSHRPERGALSPCMHRFVASTVSLTVVRVEAERVGMRYADGPPCTTPLSEPVWMAR